MLSCDHFIYPAYRLGDIKQPLEPLDVSTRQESYDMPKRDILPDYSVKCPYLTLCWGTCFKNPLVRDSHGDISPNSLYPRVKLFFDHSFPYRHTSPTFAKSRTRVD
ncbi:SPASM domain-containing protein [Aeromonas hydrophila]|nr:SPASM domain-containing protein [Aeromonas hydrophila]MBW3801089.1 SPASM domain-containing protein [Aeromonas hydrophila]MBW3817549.1 SPASM domain-containing protein [Aeromonas hydrophila]NLR35286.1 SPASM domain-containing protein [Aeromonas hydrophila]TNJ24084.1 hypothetical protein CF112_02435 [Aeromonas hydrophila]